MKRIFIILIILAIATLLNAQDPKEILRKIDRNEVYDTIKYEGEMQITISGKKYVKSFYTYAKGSQNFFTEFTNPDDEGTKYLKKDGTLYVYSEDLEDVMPITGHMLKESMMGSDLSYEDMTQNETLESQYDVEITEDTTYEGKEVYVLELTGKKKTVSYPKRKMWVEKTSNLVLKEELFALSGAILKENIVKNWIKIKGRDFPTEIEMKDLLRKNSKTEFKMLNIELDISIPDDMFSIQRLKR
ncbi:MAG: outer membrane lipoprotein-sorting protein [Spirochaetes bacterium]|nr:outer membrane lipoprotein-sorting protein [Spirochaetota bacterium]